MTRFSCRIATPTGSLLTQEVEEESSEAARRSLEGKGYYVFAVEGSSRSRGRRPSPRRRGRVSPRTLVVFNQELLALIKAGLPILTALELMGERTEQVQLKGVLAEAREAVKGGTALSAALAQHPRTFSPLYTGALQAGEQSGNLVDALSRYLEYQKRILTIRQRLRAALTYPAILAFLSGAALIFLLTFVFPTFTRIYGDMEAELPLATRWLMALTARMRDALPVLVVIAALFAVGVWRWWRTPAGRRWFDQVALHLPWVGDLVRGYLFSRLARTLAMTLGGGIPMIPSLQATFSALGNAYLAEELQPVIPRVAAGSALADALGSTGALSPLVLEMVSVGESSGSLQEMLGHVADLYDTEMDNRLSTLTSVIEPIIMVGMGLVVAIIVIVMYLPMFHLAEVVR